MWTTTREGFLSLVQDRADRDVLQVRARVPEDITAMFPAAEVQTVPGADYRYRARVNRLEVANAIHAAIMAIDYDSHFKDVALAATTDQRPERAAAYYDAWRAFARLQDYAPYSTAPRTGEPR